MNSDQLSNIKNLINEHISEGEFNVLLIDKDLNNHIKDRDMIINALKAVIFKLICI